MEHLEQRVLLSGDAKNVFATFNGSIANPNGSQTIPITLSSADFTLPKGKVVVGFQLEASGSSLDPAAVQIKDANGNTVSSLYTNADLANKTQSLVIAQLGMGSYTINAAAERGTSGAYHLAVFPAGDAGGNRVVDANDLNAIKAAYGSTAGNSK